MFTRITTHLRSQWLGLIAIFIALGGTGYAAVSIPKHSIGARQLRNGAVGNAQLAKRSVSNKKLRNRSVNQRTLANASVGSRQLRRGSVRGQQISTGAVGTAQLAPGSVGTGQLAAGSVGTGELAAGSVGQGQLGGNIVAYVAAVATIPADGQVFGANPAATTAGDFGNGTWANGRGSVSFPSLSFVSGPGCYAYASAPPNSDGTSVAISASVSNSNPERVEVRTTPMAQSPIQVFLVCQR